MLIVYEMLLGNVRLGTLVWDRLLGSCCLETVALGFAFGDIRPGIFRSGTFAVGLLFGGIRLKSFAQEVSLGICGLPTLD